MRKILLLTIILLASTKCYADVSIPDVLSQAGAKEGVLIDFKAQRGLNFVAATLAKKWGFSLVGGLVSTDGIGLAVDYNLGAALPKIDFPIMSLINELNVGVGGYMRTTTIHTDSVQTSKDDNKFGWGPTIFLKWSF